MQLILIAAISLDGRITPPGEAGPGFASPEDNRWFRGVLQHFTCSVLGRATFAHLEHEGIPTVEPGRLRLVMTRDPDKYAQDTVPDELEFTSAAPRDILAELQRRGHQRCALLGGGKIYQLFLDAGLVDALWLTLEPVILGGGTPLADGTVRGGRFELAEQRALSRDTILLNYHRPDGPTLPLPEA